jgi:hypothetical protein
MMWIVLLIVALILASPPMSRAQGQETCEDKLRSTRIYADALGKARNRQEVEAAQAISDLLKRIDTLNTQIEQMLRKKE